VSLPWVFGWVMGRVKWEGGSMRLVGGVRRFVVWMGWGQWGRGREAGDNELETEFRTGGNGGTMGDDVGLVGYWRWGLLGLG